MSARVQNHITGRLSLRPPQAEPFARPKKSLDASRELLGHERDGSAILSLLKAEFPTLADFEREFPLAVLLFQRWTPCERAGVAPRVAREAIYGVG